MGSKGVDATYAAFLATAFMPLGTVILAWIILGEGIEHDENAWHGNGDALNRFYARKVILRTAARKISKLWIIL